MAGLLLVSFLPLLNVKAAGAPWWNASWQYRQTITINHAQVAATMTNFPVLISISDSYLASYAQSNGHDIVFTDASGNKLNHQIERYNATTGGLTAWVQVPSLSSTTDTILYMYYGNPSASNQQNPSGVWDSNYLMVLHLSEASGTQFDSTPNGNNGVSYGGVVQGAAGQIDGGDKFANPPGNEYVQGTSSSLSLSDTYTVSMWFNATSLPAYQCLLETGVLANRVTMLWLQSGSNAIAIGHSPSTHYIMSTGVTVSTGQWHFVEFSFNYSASPQAVLYFDGAQVSLVNSNGNGHTPTTPGTYRVGADLQYSAGYTFNGAIDEARISNTVRSSAWVSTEYKNQKTPSSFYTVGALELSPANHPPAVSNPSPANGATLVAVLLSQLSFNVSDPENDLINYYVTTSPYIGSGSAIGVSNGQYSIPVSGLKIDTTYIWHVNATDPSGSGKWTNATFTFTTGFTIVSTSPGNKITCDRTSQQTFQISYNAAANTTWYLNGTQQQYNSNQQTTSWTYTFNTLGIFNVTALGSSGGKTVAYQWSVQVIINFASGVVQRQEGLMVPSQSWEQGWVWDENVWYDNYFNEYFMVYAGRNEGSREIGFAWSYDGLTWTKYAFNPILTTVSGTWESGEVFWPSSVVRVNGTYWMYYQGHGSGGSKTGVAFFNIEPDGAGGFEITNLTRYSGNPIVADGNWEFTCARYNSTLWIAYNGYYAYDGYTFNCLTSSDGLHWTYLAMNVAPPRDGWDSTFHYGGHIYFWNGTMYITIVGDTGPYGGSNGGVDYCRVGDWTHLTPSPYNPILPHGTGIANYTVAPEFIYNSTLDAFDVYYMEAQYLVGGSNGPSGLGLGRIYGVTGKNVAPIISSPSPADGAANVAKSISSLSFNLTDTNKYPMNYTVTTTPDIGSGSGTNVANGKYSVSVSGLAYSATYTWTVSANAGNLWTIKTFTFITGANTFFDPFATGWNYRKEIIIDHTKVVSDQINFPVLINITDSDLASKAQSNGNDILFMNGTGEATKLNHQIEFYSGSSGSLIAWVMIPHLSSTTDTVIYMYYGNPTCPNLQNPSGVWDSYFMMVQHFSQTSGTQYDSTANGNNAVPNGGVSEGIAGQIDGADSFARNVNQYLAVGSISASDWTISFWANCRDTHYPANYPIGLGGRAGIGMGGTYDPRLVYFYYCPDGTNIIWGGPIAQNYTWYYVSVTKSGTYYTLYVNGVSVASGTLASASISNLNIGRRSDSSTTFLDCLFNGTIDEARVSSIPRSAGWIATEYYNMYSPSAFYSVLQEVPNVDLTVTGVKVDNHGFSIYKNDTYVDGSSYYYPVEVTIRNLGGITASSFYVKLEVYWINGSLLETSQEIFVPILAGGTSAVVNFTSLFHPMHTGYYQLTATVDSRNNITETNKTNNSLVLNNVKVTIIGDINGDGVVNILDAVLIAQAWGATPSSSNWNTKADINHDGTVDIYDATIIELNWGETW